MKRFLRGLNHYIVFFLLAAFLVTCCILLFTNALMDSLGVVLTEENLRRTFDLDIRLIQAANGRFWTVIE